MDIFFIDQETQKDRLILYLQVNILLIFLGIY